MISSVVPLLSLCPSILCCRAFRHRWNMRRRIMVPPQPRYCRQTRASQRRSHWQQRQQNKKQARHNPRPLQARPAARWWWARHASGVAFFPSPSLPAIKGAPCSQTRPPGNMSPGMRIHCSASRLFSVPGARWLVPLVCLIIAWLLPLPLSRWLRGPRGVPQQTLLTCVLAELAPPHTAS